MNETIESINPEIYCRYSVAPFPDASSIEFAVQDNYILGSGVDFFNTENKTILAFKDESFISGYHNYVVKSSTESAILQTNSFHQLKAIINLTSEYPTTLFSFNDSKRVGAKNVDESSVPLYSAQTGLPIERCDIDKLGPFPFYPRTGTYNIKNIHMILSLTGVAHLIALDCIDENVQFPTSQGVNTVCNTLAGAIKNIYEWKQVAESPFNSSEPIAVKAKAFIDGLKLEEIAIEISDTQIPMRVSRYLNGETVANKELDEKKFITQLLKDYILKNCMYTTLNSLTKNYPENLNVSQYILDIEKNILEQDIYEYCVENGIEIVTANIEEIYNDVITKEKYSSTENQFYSNNRFYRSILKYYHM